MSQGCDFDGSNGDTDTVAAAAAAAAAAPAADVEAPTKTAAVDYDHAALAAAPAKDVRVAQLEAENAELLALVQRLKADNAALAAKLSAAQAAAAALAVAIDDSAGDAAVAAATTGAPTDPDDAAGPARALDRQTSAELDDVPLAAGEPISKAAASSAASATASISRAEAAPAASGRFRPSATNEWDRMPTEMQDMILDRAGVLTLFINGRLLEPNIRQIAAMWADVFKLDWQGNIAALPIDTLGSHCEAFWHIRTLSMHDRVKSLELRDLDEGLMQAAIRNKWLDAINYSNPFDVAWSAVRCGDVAIFEFMLGSHGVALNDAHADEAARYGHLELLKFICSRIPVGNLRTSVMDIAARYNRLECVVWLHENRSEGCTTDAMDFAAVNDHLDMVMWLHQNRAEGCTKEAMNMAAARGKLRMVQWLHFNRSEGCSVAAMSLAARNGYLEVVRFLHENRSEGCNDEAMTGAAERGYHHIVKFLFTHRTEGNIFAVAKAAARNGDMDLIAWIFKVAPEAITSAVADDAAASEATQVLDMIVDRTDVRCTPDGITFAVERNLSMLSWFRARMPEQLAVHPLAKIGGESAEPVFEWIQGHDDEEVGPADLMSLAIRDRNVDAVRWLQIHFIGTQWNRGDTEGARWVLSLRD
ncbi:hypothetical protein HK105_205338 [Polyrhizophydium stewartii]|uniref:Ankyrin repeat protein n=1 Tax=Polyrhizophydium stewartii TaxID=2732419 RepID=A0ABR4N6B7_9FUNG